MNKNTPKPKTETLVCSVGNHEWTRPTGKGKKPSMCPEHRAEAKAAAAAERAAHAREVAAQQREAKVRWERENLYPLLDADANAKLDYIDAQIASGRHDVPFLNDTRDYILKPATRRTNQEAPDEVAE